METFDTKNKIASIEKAYIWTRILDIPMWAIFNMLPFILVKDLEATPFQIAVFFTFKPIVSVFSMYWSAWVKDRPDRLRSNIVLARILSVAPFLFYPFISSPWLFILTSGIYMTMAVGVVPAWMELLKINLPGPARKKTFAYGSAFGYLGGGVLPLLFAWILDLHLHSWRWMFLGAALVSSLALILYHRYLPEILLRGESPTKHHYLKHLTAPWKTGWDLVTTRPDFACYQAAFMVMGGGLMLMQPALPSFFMDSLGLSYFELAAALALCKGVSYAVASPQWAKWMSHVDIFRFSGTVTALACLFPLLLLLAKVQLFWLYAAYICYGVMQAGSELSWNMSGPIFAKDNDSSIYTSVNIVTVGLRGCIAPALGSVLCTFTGSTFVMGMGFTMFAIATGLFYSYSRRHYPFKTEVNSIL